jgi:soluble lytic murein transglycosylase-like protein
VSARRSPIIAILAVVALLAIMVGAVTYFDPASDAESIETTATTTTTTDPGPTAAEVDTFNRAVLQNELDRQALNTALWVNRTNEQLWIERTNEILEAKAEAARQAAREAAQEAEREQPSATPPAPQPSGGGRIIGGIEVCNGIDLPTCAIVQRESGFNPTAENPTSTASGLYQFIDGTWRTCGTGYGHASSAPVSVQVACARQIWAGGAGASHWNL